MRYLIRISAAALAACMASLVALSSAPAAVTPLPKIQAHNVVGWSGMVKRPGYILVHMTGGPSTANLRWSRWTATSGKATGKIELFWCVPIATCKPTTHPVTVWANTPRTHRGARYFSRMTWQYTNARARIKRLAWTFSVQPGGSVPSWH